MIHATDEHVGADGTARKDHYGAGRQPWDDIADAGWGPAFAAGNVLKYLRRTKEREHSLESARWYHARLCDLSGLGDERAREALATLHLMLSPVEVHRLRVPEAAP